MLSDAVTAPLMRSIDLTQKHHIRRAGDCPRRAEITF